MLAKQKKAISSTTTSPSKCRTRRTRDERKKINMKENEQKETNLSPMKNVLMDL